MAYSSSILSIGYERRTPDEFLRILLEHSVTTLIDVRELPISRKKGFSKTALASLLESAGISYVHLREAGNPYRKLRAEIDKCLDLYSHYLAENPEVLDRFTAALPAGVTAVMCYEQSHEMCHRSVLLGKLAGDRRLQSVVKA